jgi:streptogramin lyase
MDASGKLWWSDLTNKLGYFNTAANPLTLSVWTLPDDAFENPTNTGPLLLLGGDVWLANWNQPNFGLFRFSPGANPNFCHYAVSGGSYATDLVVQGDKLWWLSWQSETVDSLLSLAPESGIDRQLVRYSLGVDTGTAAGMAVDGNYLWWAEDKLNGAVARFDTTTGKLKRYPLPAGAQPVNVVVAGGAVWYADVSGAVGRIDPLAAAAMETTPTASAPLTVTPECQQLTDPTPRNEMLEPGILTWSDSSTTSSVPAAGLEVVAMPSGAEPVRIAAAAEKLWIINATGDQLLRMDLRNEQKIFLPMLTR